MGFRTTLDDVPDIDSKFRRHVRPGQSKVDIHFNDLWKIVPGEYPKKLQVQAKLLYPATPDDIVADETYTDVLIQDANSGESITFQAKH